MVSVCTPINVRGKSYIYSVPERTNRGVAEAVSSSPQLANLQEEVKMGVERYFDGTSQYSSRGMQDERE